MRAVLSPNMSKITSITHIYNDYKLYEIYLGKTNIPIGM
ncbi:Uncharacterised protein [Elizabethkingia anophelis]|uniref:Uncharacterized protein n=1 Tax=Elizabethkingia anophelis TaxID=1117645 RepID=A0A7Z7LVS0_9FLAO|nr:Uncharacterised protein [Elizabethkingia anophelis]STD03024.1 Uncharacterised protein [Elizabethkingia anophelis]